MALVSTINFLPPVFRSSTNQRFLGATLDHLVSDSANGPLNGYIGRSFAPTYKVGDNYVPEPTARRTDYQLEPSVVVKDDNSNIEFTSSYIDLLQSIANRGGFANNQQRLFNTESYNYDGKFDYDKFVNYNDYFWMPTGPAALPVSSSDTPYNENFVVSRNTTLSGYTFSGAGGHANTQLTLARGGRYTFTVDQPGFKFWIQSEPGVSGADASVATINTRNVFGTKNNGTDGGVVTFNVPGFHAQDFYLTMTLAATVDAATNLAYTDIQGKSLTNFLMSNPSGIDGINNVYNLQNKTFVFVNNDVDDSFWTVDNAVVPTAQRTNVWKVNLVSDGLGDHTIELIPSTAITSLQKVFVTSGKTYASTYFWLDNNSLYSAVPLITANANYLYYQDESDPDFVGRIKLVDNSSTPIDVANDIVGKISYQSPNGIVFTNGLKIVFDSLVVPASYASKEYYVEGVGTGIALVPVDQLVVPETFSAAITTQADYVTINRASQDLNAWSRTNRWFHKDVLSAVAAFNNASIDYGPNIPGRRPIIEFEANLQLFNFGKKAKDKIDLITFAATDAFNDYEGKTTAQIESVTLVPDMRIVFANDYDTNVTNKVWQVNIERINSQNFIRLIETYDDPVVAGENMLVAQGTYAGKTFKYDGTTWAECQEKIEFNQAPLFDLVDADGYSFSDTVVYPASTFAGTRNFGYKTGTGSNDLVLGFPLSYQNFNNIGDIVFANYYDTDTFTTGAVTVACNTGYLVRNTGLTTTDLINNWTIGTEKTKQYQLFTKFYDGHVVTIDNIQQAFVQIDVLPDNSTSLPYLKVFLNNALLVYGRDYTLTKYGIYDVVLLTNLPVVGDKIDIAVYSSSVSATGYYQVPENLDYNPMNENFGAITLGQLRSHYNRLIENTAVSSIPLQDHYIKAQGGTLVQHASPVLYAMTVMNDPKVNFFDGINYARREYTKFKNKFIQQCENLAGINYTDPVSGVDAILQSINAVKNSSFPWYYSDMVPQGGTYSTITYKVLNVRQTNYEIAKIFNDTVLSNRAVIVYHNGTQLTKGADYTFSQFVPTVIISRTLAINDTIVIRDYSNTDGNFIPETPSKLGLYPKFEPAIYTDTSYSIPTAVIRGHDGSITPAYGDFRDQFLLELERRIYNNIKANYDNNMINIYDIIPGRFRQTDYTLAEWNQLLSKNFLTWIGGNNVDYTTNSYFNANNSWTWNYDKFVDTVDQSNLQGSWRAIYKYWFDTDTPQSTPWEMLGFLVKPSWWETRYGPAPYTSGNGTLWGDLAAGYVWNNGSSYIDNRYIRPGLTGFIPVDSAGNLLPPTSINMILQRTLTSAANNFSVGQWGPAETAWRRSSDYPYALQTAMALARPAEYFATQLDTSRFNKNPVTGQFSDVYNQKINTGILKINGDATGTNILRTSGYLNWIADGIKNLGIDPVAQLNNYFRNLSVQLSYKVAGFTDKKMLRVSAEQTSPGSTNSSVIIPDENYQVYVGAPTTVSTIAYSAVIIEKTTNGYAVTGYDTTNPFFNILPSLGTGPSLTIKVDNLSVKSYEKYSKTILSIPYGTTFATVQQAADFLISYERYLVSIGFSFTQFDQDLSEVRNWSLSIKEFLFWAQQGWTPGTIIALNPGVENLVVRTLGTIIGEVNNLPGKSTILDQNFVPIKSNHFDILRTEYPTGNSFQITSLNGAGIGFARFDLVQHESILIFDNVDNFGDIVYVPSQGTRQFRLKLTGSKTGAWTGALSAAGYVYSDPNISTWAPSVDYRLGDIVQFDGTYYTAATNIPAAVQFNSSYWKQIRLSDIQTGLLPSFGTTAQLSTRIYDVDNPPMDENLQLFSSGLIGFRERSYLTDLGMSIPTQTKFYQGFIKQKGTQNAINALTKATFNNVSGTISTYEEWAFRVGVYGDIDKNRYNEFVLDQGVFLTNPLAFTVTANTYSTANVIASLSLGNLYTSSNLAGATTSLYDNRSTADYPTDLPSVGYVNVNDIDEMVFNLKTTYSLSSMGAGKKIWVAKDYTDNWDVYRLDETGISATTLVYTLDTYAKLTFDSVHSFAKNDYFVLDQFGADYDGLYRVLAVPTQTTITISLQDPKPLILNSSRYTGNGMVYKLSSVVTDSVANIDELRPLHDWKNYDRVWVNNATTDGWGVYTFNRPWAANAKIAVTANTVTANDQFGSATAINSDGHWLYAGNPGNKSVQVFANVNYNFTSAETISNVNAGFGSSIDTQANLVAIGAPAAGNVHIYVNNNGTHTKLQMLHSANASGNFGANVAISADGHWLYINEPVSSQVKAYYTSNVAGAASYTLVSSLTVNATAIQTNSDGTQLFVGAANDTNVNVGNGNVYIYSRAANVFSLAQTISSQHKNAGAAFGSSLAIDSIAGNLFVGAPGSSAIGQAAGVVERWVYNSGSYVYNQTISRLDADIGTFGKSISVSSDAVVLAVGNPSSSAEEDTSFDNSATTIDFNTTNFVEYVFDSGAVYLHELLIDQSQVGNYGSYTFTENLPAALHGGDEFGTSIALRRDTILVGAPGTATASGAAYVYKNPLQQAGWALTRQQQPKVDINTIGRTFVYNKVTNNLLTTLDYVDPAKGKVLGSFAKNIDYQRTQDPALYNAGTGVVNSDYHWGPEQVGKIWWDLNTVRYIDYEQDSLIYRLTQWGAMFPGSSIQVYEWVESDVLPSEYTGSGTPAYANNASYSTYGYVDQSGTVKLKYYFWVMDKDTINYAAGKTNSTYSIAAAIENPASQGIPYSTVLRNDTVALYNVNRLLTGQNTVLHLNSRGADAGLIHSEYALVQEGNPGSSLPQGIQQKIIDSLAGQDRVGNVVPDPTLSPAQRYGINIRPRQTLFINRELALSNYLDVANNQLAVYPVIERKLLTTLNSSEVIPGPDTGEYVQVVDTYEEIGYLNTADFTSGQSVLVLDDSTQSSKWAIYTWDTPVAAQWNLTRTQSYKTNLYWTRQDWYSSTYDPTGIPDVTVANNLEFGKLTLAANTYIKVLDNGTGQFVVYYIDSTLTQNLVGIENGTIQINTTGVPATELRQILIALETEIFIDDLAYVHNSLFFIMVKYALTEQKNLDWVFKTSFLSATQYIRKLEQFPSYIADNQTYYRSYIEEVKPYRTVLREFVIDYQKDDPYNGDVTDFDLPPYWEANLAVYRSPSGEQNYDSALLSTSPKYSQWYNNYKYQVVDVVIDNGGTGFLFAPQVIISGGSGTGAEGYATIDANGSLSGVIITKGGKDYISTPSITINGTGTGARVSAVLRNVYDGTNVGHNLIRSIKTNIKFDRTTYTTSNAFVQWDQLTTANVGQTLGANAIIVSNNNLYQLSNSYVIDANITFPVSNLTVVDSSSLTNANDRIVAFSGNVDLALTQLGIDYPGVVVDGNTYTGTEYDSIIQSSYTSDLGVNPSTIWIDGGAYVDTFSSHAPQELVPGRMYESIDIAVHDTNNLGFRHFANTTQLTKFYRIAAANTTVLSANLNIGDTHISVTNAAQLPIPDRHAGRPGVVFVNGEKITYYRNYSAETPTPWASNIIVTTGNLISYGSNLYVTNGNVYGAYFANIAANVTLTSSNTLAQIRRAVDTTSPQLVHTIGSKLVDASQRQEVPYSYTGNVVLTANTTYTTTDIVSYGLRLTANISANIGDFITQVDDSLNVLATMRVLETVSTTKLIPVIIIDGGITGLPEVFDSELGFDVEGFDNSVNPLFINGNITSSYIVNAYRLGDVNDSGQITVQSGTRLITGNIWYNSGVTTPSDGLGLFNSTTVQATFLKASLDTL